MNQGKIIVGIALVLGICAGLAGYWWNYRVGHRALKFYGTEAARLIRLAPKVEYLEYVPATQAGQASTWPVKADLSQARGLIHLRNAILSDDQYNWNGTLSIVSEKFALRFSDNSESRTLYFDLEHGIVHVHEKDTPEMLFLGPLAKSLEQFLARELPRLKAEAAAEPVPAKSE
jgi:hypothetical protein